MCEITLESGHHSVPGETVVNISCFPCFVFLFLRSVLFPFILPEFALNLENLESRPF